MKYKLIAFDLDETLTQEWTIEKVAKNFGFFNKFKKLNELAKIGKIKNYQITLEVAKYFKGKRKLDVYKICENVHLTKGVKDVINKLKKKGLKTAIITTQFSPISEYFKDILKIDHLICPKLLSKNGIFTGKVEFKKYFDKNCPYDPYLHAICKRIGLIKLAKKEKISLKECVAVGNGISDLCMFKTAGLSIGFNPTSEIKKLVDIVITDFSKIIELIN